MKQIENDPILHFTGGLVSALKWLNWIAVGLCILGALAATGGYFLEQSASEARETAGFAMLATIAGVGCLLLGKFFKRLREVIDSVGQGSPLTFANTQKLKAMAVLLAGVMAIDLILNFTGPYWMPTTQQDNIDIYIDGTLSFLSTLLPVLLLVILARIFHLGAAMQEELEGTV
jgi:hypothetical protein